MSDHYNGLMVVLKKDVGQEHMEKLVAAIELLDGVLSVCEHVSDFESHIANDRARHELGSALMAVLYPDMKR
jgi:hypothetical protein